MISAEKIDVIASRCVKDGPATKAMVKAAIREVLEVAQQPGARDHTYLTEKDRLNIKVAMVHLEEAKFHTASGNLREILSRFTGAQG